MKKLAKSVEDFKELVDECYFIDKTGLLKDLHAEKVVLYTRPRRFGKTLNMSMIEYFYNVKEKDNAYLFHGLEISKHKEVMEEQNKYPVISITFKGMKQFNFEEQMNDFKEIIAKILRKYSELKKSDKLEDKEKVKLESYEDGNINLAQLGRALEFISECLQKHYNEKVIILIDEYDVPLQHAYLYGYYDEMVNLMRNVLSAALKTNKALKRGILTGCLRIAKESIFTGLNNFSVYGISEEISSQYFGFTPEEVKQILKDYNLLAYEEDVKTWYDGYMFGKQEMYNPWSIIQYVYQASRTSNKKPLSFWANTSGNDIVMQYITHGDSQMRQDFDTLMNKKSIVKEIKPELTYREMDNLNNIYSFLLFTGYLKIVEVVDIVNDRYELKIPNEEVRKVYRNQFNEYFKEVKQAERPIFIQAMLDGNLEKIKKVLNKILSVSVSYYDNKESFYHGFLVGMFQGIDGYTVISNKESGEGRFDIVLLPDDIDQKAIIIECKHVQSLRLLREAAKQGAVQIQDKRYEEMVENEGYESYIGYGISFCKKHCYVVKSDV